ncbi:group II intron maturase-specific domain-containing protein [Desulfofarcimen acetoxidans]|uniref:group II intron maturase-specific domain-containing protein n=1 Tax=Desulfofarcimen acetoxidans TaxID=58138 RepID=UPI000A06F5C5
MKARIKILTELKETFRRFQSQPVSRVIELINPVLRGWVNYYRVGNSGRWFIPLLYSVKEKALYLAVCKIYCIFLKMLINHN